MSDLTTQINNLQDLSAYLSIPFIPIGDGSGRGILSINKTNTEGLIDTYTISYSDGGTPTTFTVTNGADGTNGVDGADGFSPSIVAIRNPEYNGYDLTITTANTVQTITIPDGVNGTNGIDGIDGIDGVSPVIITENDILPNDYGLNINTQNVPITLPDGSQTIPTNLTIGEVTTLTANSSATATITGTAPNLILNLGIPKGVDGIDGTNGVDGADGVDGVEGQLQSDWNQNNALAKDYIKNKPTIPVSTRKLIWTNPYSGVNYPTFEDQTVNATESILSTDLLLVVARLKTDIETTVTGIIMPSMIGCNIAYVRPLNNYVVARGIFASGETIQFSVGSCNNEINNDYMIPLRVYKI